jgi:regulator of sigma E protease
MVFYFGWINEVPVVEVKQTAIEWVISGSPAAQAGLQPGDIIHHFADADNPDWDKVFQGLITNPNQTLPIAVERGGRVLQFALHIPGELKADDLAGILPQFTSGPIGVQEVQPGMPAEQAGLRAGDAIQSVDGHPFHTVTTLLAYMQDGQGKPISLVVVRNGAALGPIVAHPAKLDTGWKLGFIPKPIPTRTDPLPLNTAINKSTQFCVDNSTLLVQVLKRIVIHKIAASNALSGPLGIARAAGDVAETKGWVYKFNLAAQISISLGILNLMPFPILDGGMILFLLIESVLRRDISINLKERIYQGAFVLLVAFFVFVTFNDIAKLPFFTHLKP